MYVIEKTSTLSVNELDEKTRAELVRDVAYSVFFGFYDERKGYIKSQFKQGDEIQGIYAFLNNIQESSDFMKEYQDTCFINEDNIDEDLSKCDIIYWRLNPYLGKGFTNLINDFQYHLDNLGERYNIILNKYFYNDLIMHILEEIDILCHQFMPNINIGSDFYNIEDFIDKYMYNIRMIYNIDCVPELSDLYKGYKTDRYDVNISYNNGSLIEYYDEFCIHHSFNTGTITDYFDGKPSVRYRDNLI